MFTLEEKYEMEYEKYRREFEKLKPTDRWYDLKLEKFERIAGEREYYYWLVEEFEKSESDEYRDALIIEMQNIVVNNRVRERKFPFKKSTN